MNFKLSALAAAAVLASGVVHADIANPSQGNGSMFFSLWDANGSYTFDMNTPIDMFEASLAADGLLDLQWDLSADANLMTFMSTVVDPTALKWNIVAADGVGARRMISTYADPTPAVTITNDVFRSTIGAIEASFLNDVNAILADDDSTLSISVNSASSAWAGKSSFGGNRVAGTLNFGFFDCVGCSQELIRINGAATGIARSTYSNYFDGSTSGVSSVFTDLPDGGAPIFASFDGSTIFIGVTPVPEAETWAMLLAGLGLVGVMAHRRRNTVA